MSEQGPDDLDLTCYLAPGWEQLIRPAPAERDWMDATPDGFAYRCLPLSIANTHGWELLAPCDFFAFWTGGAGLDAVRIGGPAGTPRHLAPISTFGHGVLTFHVSGLFRTPPEWNLWVGGSPNHLKDAIQPLTAIVETDWATATFTMNWRFTRANTRVDFTKGEPIGFIFPLPRGYLNAVRPRFAPMSEDPATESGFKVWSQSRVDFNSELPKGGPKSGAAAWQRHYFQGVTAEGVPGPRTHQTRLRLRPFKAD